MSGRRLPEGGSAIDRTQPLRFTFEGGEYEGFVGDMLASALLANGVGVVCRSPIMGRPRGVFSAGEEEPSAFVEVSAPWFEPVVAATMVNLVDGLNARGRPGVGVLPEDPPSPRPAIHRHRHIETLVIGHGGSIGGVAVGSENGDRTLVALDRGRLPDIESARDVEFLEHTMGIGLYDDGYVVLHERAPERDILWHVRAQRVILATGAHERPIPFVDCDRPGVMLASAARKYVELFGVLPGERVAVFTTNHGAYDDAAILERAGATIAVVVDVGAGGRAAEDARARGWDVRTRSWVSSVEGEPAVTTVHVEDAEGRRETTDADLLLVSGGWNPAVQLYRTIGGGMRYDDDLATFVPDGTGPAWLEVVGAAAGDGLPTSEPFWYSPAHDLSRHFVDLQRDQTVQDVLDAVGGGLRSVEHVKRATYIGTAIDQGRTSGVLTAEIVNAALGWELGAQGPTNARPPYVPAPFTALAGLERGPALLDPIRTTPIHDAHVARRAVFEDVGQWKRPRYFPLPGEEMSAAVERECLAVRNAVGILDASTLGKIEVVGRDAGIFLDRMYTNRMSNLPVGSIRYGLMLGLDGMVFDDGVAMRLADDNYLVTTTTGGAAAVMDRFEEWLQTEWPDLRVSCTSVTEQWAVVAVGGPRAREVVAAAGTDVDLDRRAFPWMTWRDGTVAGVGCRLCRVSFHGELSFELHVAGWDGRQVWDAVLEAGAGFGITPYGTEAMHVLRAEKGYVAVGQDTDGTVTPNDLGMGWIVNLSKGDFVGKRSLVRSDVVRADRKQFVGLLPEDPTVLIPEGAQLVATDDVSKPPVPMLGHVTSSYWSPALGRTFAIAIPNPSLGRTFALAMLSSGRARIGETLFASFGDRIAPVTVTAPVLYDPRDERRDG